MGGTVEGGERVQSERVKLLVGVATLSVSYGLPLYSGVSLDLDNGLDLIQV